MPALAPALVTLGNEVNTAYPDRPKVSDGWLGDAAHQARKSDHNVGNDGLVHAIDVTDWDADTKVQIDDVAFALVEHLRKTKDPRVKYVIFRSRMFSSYSTSTRRAWEWGPYTGTNPHIKHCHISCNDDPYEDDARGWGFKRPGTAPVGFHMGDSGMGVEFIENMMNILIPYRMNTRNEMKAKRIRTDGWYEGETAAAVGEFQRFCNAFWKLTGSTKRIAVDGIAGPVTLGLIAQWVPVALANSAKAS